MIQMEALLGLGRDAGEIDAGQMALRAVVVYAVTLAIVRLGSRRLMGKATAFDVILGFMIGSVMSRGINGSAGLGPTLLGGAVLVGMHGLLAVLAYRLDWFGRIVKGRPILLVEDGRPHRDAMRRTSVSARDLEEAIRLRGHEADPAGVRLAYLERDGTISIISRAEGPRILDVSVADGVQTVRIALR